MLPHVHTENGDLACNRGILVLGRDDTEASLFLDQPSPTTALYGEKGGREGLLELGQAVPGLFDLGYQSRRCFGLRIGAPGRREILPEEGVVDVASSIELDGRL